MSPEVDLQFSVDPCVMGQHQPKDHSKILMAWKCCVDWHTKAIYLAPLTDLR
jgi:hypothetical protein